VLTGEEWAADGLGTLDPEFMAEDVGGPTGVRHQGSTTGTGSRALCRRALLAT